MSGERELVVCGTLTLDTTERDGSVHANVPGGSALYAATAASLLIPPRIVGTVGTDYPFDALKDVWARGVDRSTIEVLPGATFRWHARYDADGETRTTLSRDPGVSRGRLPHVGVKLGARYAVLMASTDPRIQGHVRHACAGATLAGLDSMAHWWQERAAALRPLLRRVDVLFVNELELSLAAGTSDLAEAAEVLIALGTKVVVVKRGPRGAWLKRRERAPIEVPAVTVPDVVDTTGAGDAFAGACMAAMIRAKGEGDAYALKYAAAVASFAVEGFGVSALVRSTTEEIEQRMAGIEVTGGG